MLIDYHVHSDYSNDSSYPMESVVKDAIARGIKEICFTDHVDYGTKWDWHDPQKPDCEHAARFLNVDYPRYFDEITLLQKKYESTISIKKGLEFGVQIHTIDDYKALSHMYPMDFILLSIHQIEDKEFWTGDFQTGKTEAECYRQYYQELYDIVTQFHDYSCLAHMDLIRRYLNPSLDAFEATKDQIAEILNVVIRDGKGIEINTSSVRYGLKGLTPSLEILKLFHQLGGTIVTIGSDSHEPDHLGFNIEESKIILKEIGYKYYCTFDAMKPIFHEL